MVQRVRTAADQLEAKQQTMLASVSGVQAKLEELEMQRDLAKVERELAELGATVRGDFAGRSRQSHGDAAARDRRVAGDNRNPGIAAQRGCADSGGRPGCPEYRSLRPPATGPALGRRRRHDPGETDGQAGAEEIACPQGAPAVGSVVPGSHQRLPAVASPGVVRRSRSRHGRESLHGSSPFG